MIIAKVFITPRGSEIGDTHPPTFPIHSLSSPPVQKEHEAGQNIGERVKKPESISNETMRPGTSLIQKSYYIIQIGAFRDLENARDLTEALEKKGLDAYWTATGRKGGGTLYRVFSRRFVDRNEAVKYMADNKISNDYPDSFVREISVSNGNP
jgi:cell division septation protein DedD